MITKGDLTNRDVDMTLPLKGAKDVKDTLKLAYAEELIADCDDELVVLRQRMAEAHHLRPPRTVVDRASWATGRDDVLAFLERLITR